MAWAVELADVPRNRLKHRERKEGRFQDGDLGLQARMKKTAGEGCTFGTRYKSRRPIRRNLKSDAEKTTQETGIRLGRRRIKAFGGRERWAWKKDREKSKSQQDYEKNDQTAKESKVIGFGRGQSRKKGETSRWPRRAGWRTERKRKKREVILQERGIKGLNPSDPF